MTRDIYGLRLCYQLHQWMKFHLGHHIFWHRYHGILSFDQEYSVRDEFVSLLESCTDIESLQKVHTQVFLHGFGNNIFVASKLINCYSKFGHLYESRCLFHRIINKNLSLWNSIFVGHFRSSQYEEVLKVYLELKFQGIGINSSAITFGLKSCMETHKMEFGKGMQGDSIKVGCNGDKFVGSALVGFYFHFGDTVDAEKAFEEISLRDVVIYTAMITGYARMASSYAAHAFRFVSYMQEEGLEPNRVTLVSLLQAAGHIGAIKEAKLLHAYAIRREMDLLDIIIETSIIDMYAKCGDLDSADLILTQRKSRGVASWNSLISTGVQLGQILEALALFSLMVKEGVEPDLITIASVLMACVEAKLMLQGTSIHGYVIKKAVDLDLVSFTSLIDFYSKCNQLDKAKILFYRMKMRDVVAYNVIISGCLSAGLPDESFHMLSQMFLEGLKPNIATIQSLLSACADHADIRRGKRTHGYIIRNGFDSDVEVSNHLLHIYAKHGQVGKARLIFSMIRSKDMVSWTSMIMGYANQGCPKKSLALYLEMKEERFAPDSVILLSLLRAFSQLGCLNHTREAHGYLKRSGLEEDFTMINSLITTYAKCGRFDTSRKLFDGMREKALSSWNAIIDAHGMNGQCLVALDLFYQMLNAHVEPDGITFTSILSACSHAGLIKQGQHIFEFMKHSHANLMREEHYSCMVDMLGRAGFLEEAYKVAMCLPDEQCASALCSLLSACRIYKAAEMGGIIGKKLHEINPKFSGMFALQANIYAEAGEWGDVERMWSLAKDRGHRKLPACSTVDSRGLEFVKQFDK